MEIEKERRGTDQGLSLKPKPVFESKDWLEYLKQTDVVQSSVELRKVFSRPEPIDIKQATWLNKVKECPLFLERVWHSCMEEEHRIPFTQKELSNLINDCANQWLLLAQEVAKGSLSFEVMEKVIRLQPDATNLAQAHLLEKHDIQLVHGSYRDFRILLKLRHLIGPFIAALRFFKIIKCEEIETIHHFINYQLIENWNQTTLVGVREKEFLEALKDIMDVDPERPNTMSAIEFIGSLITEENGTSPLIEWLKTKNEQDMETMKKILQGHLGEAYRKNKFLL